MISVHSDIAGFTTDDGKRLRIRLDHIKAADLAPLSQDSISGLMTLYRESLMKLKDYGIGITPLHSVNFRRYGYHAFCPPGLGLKLFHTMGQKLCIVLRDILLPKTEKWKAWIDLVLTTNGSGYYLLYSLFANKYKVLNPSFDLPVPTFGPDCGYDLNKFGQQIEDYGLQLRLRGVRKSRAQLSKLFLEHLRQHPQYLPAVSGFLTDVIRYSEDPTVEVAFPAHLTVLQLANTMSEVVTADSILASPSAVPTDLTANLVQQLFMSAGVPPQPMDQVIHRLAQTVLAMSDPGPHIQGHVCRVAAGGGKKKPSSVPTRWPVPRRGRGDEADLHCAACKRPGHSAARCIMLAVSLYIWKFMKDKSNSALLEDVAKTWLQHHQQGGQADPTCVVKMAEQYSADVGISVDTTFDEMDWDFFDPQSE